jgi:glycine oxidase
VHRTSDLLVVGAGAIGLASAWRAAQRGASVVVLDRAGPGAGASTAAAGLISPSDPHEWEGDLGRVNLAAMAGWERFAEEVAEAARSDPGYARTGSLRVARSAAEEPPLGIAERALEAAGLPC